MAVTIRTSPHDPQIKHGAGKLDHLLKNFFNKQKEIFKRELVKYYTTNRKSADDDLEKLFDNWFGDWEELVTPVEQELSQAYDDAARSTMGGLDIISKVDFDALDQNARDFAAERSAELVGMSWDGNDLVDNPNAEYAITDGTRNELKRLVTRAFDDGLSPKQLADSIDESVAFSGDRALLVARTEMARAHVQGALDAAMDSGVVVAKRWLLGSEHDHDDECDENDAEGLIAFDDEFSSGDDGPPAHPNCVCALVFYTAADEEAADFVGNAVEEE